MPINIHDLDGKYEVRSETSYGGPFYLKGDGVTEIKDGLTYRKDKSGCVWESSFNVLGDGQIQIESTVDPSHAADDFYISDNEGKPTKEIVIYKSTLEARRINGKIVMQGEIKHGNEITRLTLTQL